MSYKNRKTTIENAEEYFGPQGIKFFAFAMVVSMTSWFAIQLNMMSISVIDLFSLSEDKDLWLLFFNLGLGLLITICTLYGIRGVGFLANFSLPFFLLTLGYAAYTVNPTFTNTMSAPFSFGGVSLVIAFAIAVVVDMPTYYRFAKTSKDGEVSIALLFILFIPLLEICGVYITSGVSGGNILEVLKREDSALWNIWVASFLVLAGWTTNNLNLYSGAICLQSIFKEFSEKKALLFIGIAGTIISCFDLLKHFEITLDVIGIFIAAMGSVVLTRYVGGQLLRGKMFFENDHIRNLLGWMAGIALGFLSFFGYGFTSIALVDSVIGALLGTLLTMSCKETYEKI